MKMQEKLKYLNLSHQQQVLGYQKKIFRTIIHTTRGNPKAFKFYV